MYYCSFIIDFLYHCAFPLFSPSAFEKSALAQSIVTAFPRLKDPQGITGYVCMNFHYVFSCSLIIKFLVEGTRNKKKLIECNYWLKQLLQVLFQGPRKWYCSHWIHNWLKKNSFVAKPKESRPFEFCKFPCQMRALIVLYHQRNPELKYKETNIKV